MWSNLCARFETFFAKRDGGTDIDQMLKSNVLFQQMYQMLCLHRNWSLIVVVEIPKFGRNIKLLHLVFVKIKKILGSRFDGECVGNDVLSLHDRLDQVNLTYPLMKDPLNNKVSRHLQVLPYS